MIRKALFAATVGLMLTVSGMASAQAAQPSSHSTATVAPAGCDNQRCEF